MIVFSTGLGRSRDDCAYLGRHWAACGYVVVHVQHPGSDEQARQRTLRPKKELQKAFYEPHNIRNRPLDLTFVIDQLAQLQREGQSSGQRCDLTRIGAAGHDFGAQTALALAGAVLPGNILLADPRVKAVVAVSAPVPLGEVSLEAAFGGIEVPCLHVTGTADNSIVGTTTASQRRLPFDYSRAADRYLVTLFGADHLTCSGHNRPANAASDALFQRLIAADVDCFLGRLSRRRRGRQGTFRRERPRGLHRGGGAGGKKTGPRVDWWSVVSDLWSVASRRVAAKSPVSLRR